MPNKSSNAAGPAAHTLGYTNASVAKGTVAASMMSAGKGSVPTNVSNLQAAGANYQGGGRMGASAHAVGFQSSGIARGSTAAQAMTSGRGVTPASVSQLQSAGARPSGAGPAKK